MYVCQLYVFPQKGLVLQHETLWRPEYQHITYPESQVPLTARMNTTIV